MNSVYFVNPLHISSVRDYQGRMTPDKPDNAKIARQFGFDFWDGDRKYGYGGYKDDGRWYQVAEKMIKTYGLTPESKVLDIGCGKGYLGKWINKLGGGEVWGCDISDYALEKCVIPNKFKFEAGKDELKENYDLIISITTLHNLLLPNLKQAIKQIDEHSKQAYICVESYRNEKELYNLQCWALTCEQFLRPEEWRFLFDEWRYKGDYEFIFFE
jgi:2-polyprenyl-3-methyl-5-hydroxy-6-metoxy-1,4-benzoquinol methylase